MIARTRTPHIHAPHTHGHACNGRHEHDEAGVDAREIQPRPGQVVSRLRIEQMDCPTEASLIEKRLGGVRGTGAMGFDLMGRVLTIAHAPGAEADIKNAIRSIGMSAQELTDDGSTGAVRLHTTPAMQPRHRWLLVIAGVTAVAAEAAHWSDLHAMWPALLAICSIACCGLGTYRKGWIAIRHGQLNINALMSIAVTGAALIGQWPEAAMVMFLFTLAELIETRSLDRARRAMHELFDLTVREAQVRRPDGAWENRAIEAIEVGDTLRVMPGGRLALDGVVVHGRSNVNQAPITGESLPVEKSPGDTVYAGTINHDGALEYRVTAAAGNSTLARIARAVEQAQARRAPAQRLIDRFAAIYTPAVVVLAVGTAIVPPLLWGGAWLDWLYQALVLLVIACPCALVVSTPVTVVSGLTAAARAGILVKGGVYLEQGRHLEWLALDKTGTLTTGHPVQTDFLPLGGADPAQVHAVAAQLARASDHPVSKAIAAAATSASAQPAPRNVKALPGRGSEATLDGALYTLANRKWLQERGWHDAELDATLDALEAQGKTTTLLCDTERPLAIFAVADTVRPTSQEAIRELEALGVRTMMLTGDNAGAAAAIAREAGISEVRSQLLPADKLAAIEGKMAGAKGRVAMVGDGINDAPALARADIGIAMGAAGTDTAIETADVALMDDDLRKLPMFVKLARATHRTLVQNITLALGIKAVFLALALAGHATLWMAVFADVGASLIVVANGLRLLRRRHRA